MKKNEGFTLIELLITIAIIGILSSVVVITIGGQVEGANDAKLKIQAAQLRTPAVIESLKTPAPTGTKICMEVNKKHPAIGLTERAGNTECAVGEICCYARGVNWAFVAALSDGTFYCIDGNEVKESRTKKHGGGGAC